MPAGLGGATCDIISMKDMRRLDLAAKLLLLPDQASTVFRPIHAVHCPLSHSRGMFISSLIQV